MTDQFGALGRGTVLVLHAHPDDETFATGAATASLAQQGCRVVLRVASGGEASERGATVREARHRRARRLSRACQTLGIAEWDWIDEGRWLDTGGARATNSLTNAVVDDVADAIAQHVRRIAPDAVLTVGSDGLTRHPDHILMHQAVNLAVGGTVPVFGSSLRADDVARGHQRLAALLPGVRVGSGRMTGSNRTDLLTVRASPSAGSARRAALNHYAPGLGTRPLENLLRTYPGRGDSLLLRGVLDTIGWSTERYELPAERVDVDPLSGVTAELARPSCPNTST
ncbi:PIG-L deacetylase family protein [Streptomyces sp. NPDC058391]|uniref:PIG-L deacetylase family protein n=1 Tax=unclassified Streptomyces TaxID=2593676 RepID=UPI00366999A4